MLSELPALVSGRRRYYRVSGESMSPTLASGELLAIEVSRDRKPEKGQIVVVRDPERPGKTLVKRVRSRGDTTFAVGSDAPDQGRDSRHFGSLSLDALIGRVTWVWSRRRGLERIESSMER